MTVVARYIVVVLALAPLGCARFAKQPPTPARDIPPASFQNASAPPGERYFLLIFGSESRPKRAKYTHTWATIARVTEVAGGPPAIEPHTISWMPATLDIRPWSLRVEPGKNLDLAVTIEEMLRNDEHISMWGPYEIGPVLYQRFLVQKQFMESGRVGYQCIDAIGEAARTGSGCDCIHAVTDMDPLYDRTRYPLAYFGKAASRHIVRQIHERPTIIRPGHCHDWLIPMLGLDKYPIEREKWNGPVVENTPENLERFLRSQSGRNRPGY